jgi:hypothetical protein
MFTIPGRKGNKGDQEVVKTSGSNELVWVVILMHIEATLGISLYSYLYLKLAKVLRLIIS